MSSFAQLVFFFFLVGLNVPVSSLSSYSLYLPVCQKKDSSLIYQTKTNIETGINYLLDLL